MIILCKISALIKRSNPQCCQIKTNIFLAVDYDKKKRIGNLILVRSAHIEFKNAVKVQHAELS